MQPSLPSLYATALDKAARASRLPTINDETQELIQDALSDLVELASRVANLSLFSSNEVLDDISTSDLMYLALPFIRAEVQNRVKITNSDDRKGNLTQVQHHLNTFTSSLEMYGIITETERALYGQQSSSITDATKRRELKIRQYKAEKDLRARVGLIRKGRRQLASEDSSCNEFELVASLLPPNGAEDVDIETEDVLRETTLLLLRLLYAQACVQLESLDQEVQLLRNVPPQLPRPPADERHSKTEHQADLWKLDPSPAPRSSEPLLDPHGKPLRPFTILPAGALDRARLQSQVFGPGHRLPSMTIDEYLEIERQRGGILPAGGPQSAKPTPSEQLAIDSEMEGTVLGEVKAEEKRHRDEQWAEYTEGHPRGAGNTMNRG